ncbi:unnamed protein product [Echinostoma caproni]|uniref:Mitochondrial import inner membrane translocase subunit n=1 Tax=Echinostoma caproni TaxID=27848 RepID=A0A3P8GVT3_9TREM|nr:unnamed protein product [Echinostoma caproni]
MKTETIIFFLSERIQLIEQMKQEVALATTQALLQNMSDICFKKCVTKPGNSLDNSEQKCVANCMDRYVDSWNLVSKTFAARIRRESSRIGLLSWESGFSPSFAVKIMDSTNS